mmetsp:Transcript_70802/g.142540  ORF Transcript_70802/g.142540 Transcript_70802/m.142540 type:complete len:371 (+) Transcript_70802:41-1153(+)
MVAALNFIPFLGPSYDSNTAPEPIPKNTVSENPDANNQESTDGDRGELILSSVKFGACWPWWRRRPCSSFTVSFAPFVLRSDGAFLGFLLTRACTSHGRCRISSKTTIAASRRALPPPDTKTPVLPSFAVQALDLFQARHPRHRGSVRDQVQLRQQLPLLSVCEENLHKVFQVFRRAERGEHDAEQDEAVVHRALVAVAAQLRQHLAVQLVAKLFFIVAFFHQLPCEHRGVLQLPIPHVPKNVLVEAQSSFVQLFGLRALLFAWFVFLRRRRALKPFHGERGGQRQFGVQPHAFRSDPVRGVGGRDALRKLLLAPAVFEGGQRKRPATEVEVLEPSQRLVLSGEVSFFPRVLDLRLERGAVHVEQVTLRH